MLRLVVVLRQDGKTGNYGGLEEGRSLHPIGFSSEKGWEGYHR